MAATLTQDRFTGPEWIFERKFDGIRRSPHWLKMKCEAKQAFVVGGFTDPQGGRVGLGALLVGYFAPRQSSGRPERMSKGEGDDFVFAGKIGTGFDTKLLLDLRARLDRLEIAKSPFTKGTGLPTRSPRVPQAHWAHPEIVIEVAFIEWTVHGKLRHPRLLGVRTDKSVRQIIRTPSHRTCGPRARRTSTSRTSVCSISTRPGMSRTSCAMPRSPFAIFWTSWACQAG